MSSLFTVSERASAQALGRLAYENPFTPARIAVERAALGPDFSESGPVWTADAGDQPPPDFAAERPNVVLLRERAIALTERCATKLSAGKRPSEQDLGVYEDLALYALFAKYEGHFYGLSVHSGSDTPRMSFYREFARDFERWLRPAGVELSVRFAPEHVFAVFFQVRRAFHYIFRVILGRSPAAARLRAAAWQSVFTHDLRRYHDGLYRRMHDVPTLVTGATGTGKDLVAQAIGMARYIPFDEEKMRFVEPFAPSYHALSLSALSPTLIESELFGHRRGAFTGAIQERIGWVEACSEHGTVFLDEIGELDGAIQVKLLRVLQSRAFQRIGETTARRFAGKIVAATNRDLAAEMAAGRFREDLYYRLCADRIETPTLRERIADDPDELPTLVALLSRRIAGEEAAAALTDDVMACVEGNLGSTYPWPGNVRELEQCIRNVMVRKVYQPPRSKGRDPLGELDRALQASHLDSDALLTRYCTLTYARTRSFVETGRHLGMDRRTVKERIDAALLRELEMRDATRAHPG